MVAWTLAAVGGSVAVWWLSSYLETLTALAQTDREAALTLFRSRAMPALLVVVGVAVAAGAVLLRQGLQIARGAEPSGPGARQRARRGRLRARGRAARPHLSGALAAGTGVTSTRSSARFDQRDVVNAVLRSEITSTGGHLPTTPAQLDLDGVPTAGPNASRCVAQHVTLLELREHVDERLLQRALVVSEKDPSPGLVGEGLEELPPFGSCGVRTREVEPT